MRKPAATSPERAASSCHTLIVVIFLVPARPSQLTRPAHSLIGCIGCVRVIQS